MAGLYVHIPYCKKLCNYCDFYRQTDLGSKGEYIGAISREAAIRHGYLAGQKVETVYIGGGTPSVFSVSELKRIIETIKLQFPWDNGSEFTIEVNPDDVTPRYFDGLLELGINRISIGIQSWRDRDLTLMNRRHNSVQAGKAIKSAISSGFNNISVDLIYGIPGLSSEEWEENINKTLEYSIQHLSVYHLTIEKGTIFEKMCSEGLLEETDEEISIAQYGILLDKTGKAGFINYEISNFGKEGFFSRHNTSYWQQIPYIGLGPSAHSFNGFSRQWNVYDVNMYINEIKKGKLIYEQEQIDPQKRFNEYIMTSLRTMWGINLDLVEERFDKEMRDYVKTLSVKYIEYGMMEAKEKALVLTKQGIMISDNIISEFMII